MPQYMINKKVPYVNHTLLRKVLMVQDKSLISRWSYYNNGDLRFYDPVEFYECPNNHHRFGLVDTGPGRWHGTQYRFMCLNCEIYVVVEHDYLWNPSAYETEGQ